MLVLSCKLVTIIWLSVVSPTNIVNYDDILHLSCVHIQEEISNTKSEVQFEKLQEEQTDEQPGGQTDEQPGEQTDEQSGEQTDVQSGAQSELLSNELIDELSEDYVYDEIYTSIKLESMEQQLSSQDLDVKINFNKLLSGVVAGDGEYVCYTVLATVKSILFKELVANKTLMLQLIAIALIGSIFVNISGNFGQGFISENGFYVTYLIMTSLMLTSFTVTMNMVEGAIGKVLDLIRIMIPTYALAMNYVGNTATSVGMYEIIMVGVWIVQVIILRFILPMIKFYVIISLINNLNKEDNFSKLCKLINNLVGWMLKTIVVFVAGLNIIKSLIEPQIDALSKNTVARLMSSIPGGGMVSVLTGTFLGAGMVIKNSIGVVGIILLALVVLIPCLKTFLILLSVRITGAIIQPVGDRRYVDGVEALAQGMVLLLQTIGSSVVLFMLTIAIMAFASLGV
ncbi:MAG: stage III sporulation protein AE [Wujia sp.]